MRDVVRHRQDMLLNDKLIGHLMAEVENERQCLVLKPDADPSLKPTGLQFVSIEHEGARSNPNRKLIGFAFCLRAY